MNTDKQFCFIRVHPCSSVAIFLLVITALHEPAGGFAVDAVEGAIGKRDVPLVAVPGVGSPPVAVGAPGTGQIEDFAADTIGHYEAGLATSDGDTGGAPRAEEAQGEAGGRRWPPGGGDPPAPREGFKNNRGGGVAENRAG